MGDVTSAIRARVPRPVLVALALSLLWPLGLAATADEALTGIVAIDHGDNFAERMSGQVPMLEVSGERLELRNVSAASLAAGTRVTVRGRRIGSAVYVDHGGIRPARQGAALAATAASTSMDKRVAVLMVNFVAPTPTPTQPPLATDSPLPTDSHQPTDTPAPIDTPSPTPTLEPTLPPTPSPSPSVSPSPSPSPTPPPQPWTADFLRGVYFTNTRSVADYYREVSNGQMSVTGDVFGWFTVPADTTSCNHTDWGNAARAAATASGVDLSAYTNVAVVFPKQSACWWVGMAQLPGRNSYVNGSAGWTSATWLFVPTHELGHNFGMNHASTISCREAGVRVAFSGDCTLDEYGDPHDTMGGNGQRHFNTWHRWQIGTLTAADVQTITSTGTYSVAPAEAAGGAPRVLRIARPSGNYFYLEYRQPYGRYDNFATTAAVVNGVSIRVAPGVGSLSFSKLIDTNPQTSTYTDAALGVGHGFADKASNIFVITQSVSATGASVYVQVGPDTNLPTAPADLITTVDAAGAVDLTWAAATDDLFIGGYQVMRDGLNVGWAYGTSFSDPNPTQAQDHTYSVSAVDGAGNVGPGVSSSVFVADTTKPGSPKSLSATAIGAHSVVLAWNAATDNVGVTGYQVSRGGSPLATVSTRTFTDESAPDGFGLTYQVRAVDAAGNVGPAASAAVSLTDVTAPVLDGPLALSIGAEGAIKVSWPAGSDNVGVTGYSISRDAVPLASLAGTRYLDPGLAQAAAYAYAVVAVDAAGNRSAALSGSIYLPDITSPTAPSALSVTQAGPRSVDLHWTAASDNVGVDHYAVTVDGTALVTTTGLSLLGVTVTDGPAHQFAVAAVDDAGNPGPTADASLVLPDVSAPSAVSSFSAAAVGAASVALSWSAAADNVGIAGYRISRDGVPLTELSASALSYTDAGVALGPHTYSLAAFDAAGNLGPAVSATVSLVDLVAPSVPLNVAGVALSGRRISLTWSASTDDRPGTITYRIFRGKRRIAVTTTTKFVDRPALVRTYKYRVKAVDAAGNVSAFSSAIWVTAIP